MNDSGNSNDTTADLKVVSEPPVAQLKKDPVPNDSRAHATLRHQRCVHLRDIHPNLFLSNFPFVQRVVKGLCQGDWPDFEWFFDLSNLDIHLCPPKHPRNYVSACLDDAKSVDYVHFSDVMLELSQELNVLLEQRKNVLVFCHAGINRSASLVVTYAGVFRRFEVDKAVAAMEAAKEPLNTPQSKRWLTLTNKTFVAYLEQLVPAARELRRNTAIDDSDSDT